MGLFDDLKQAFVGESKPAKPRKRKVSAALRAYALLTTSAAHGAVRRV